MLCCFDFLILFLWSVPRPLLFFYFSHAFILRIENSAKREVKMRGVRNRQRSERWDSLDTDNIGYLNIVFFTFFVFGCKVLLTLKKILISTHNYTTTLIKTRKEILRLQQPRTQGAGGGFQSQWKGPWGQGLGSNKRNMLNMLKQSRKDNCHFTVEKHQDLKTGLSVCRGHIFVTGNFTGKQMIH